MDDLISPNLKLPYLAPAQAKKHVTHNEALRQLDALVQLSVLSIMVAPPHTPDNGLRIIIGINPEGLFLGKDNDIAAFQDGAWIYYKPRKGWRAYVEAETELYVFTGENWISVSSQSSLQETDIFGINASSDEINRLTVKSPATLFDNEGEGHQLKINKSDEEKTSSLLFQTQYASNAEIGLIGDNKLRLKVSANGSDFKDSLIANSETGHVSFPHGINIEKMGSSVDHSGGEDHHYGVPSVSVLYYGRQNLTLTQGRMYFCPLYVDRPTKLAGGFIAQSIASSTPGAIIRAGIYKLGQASGNNWEVGERLRDLGAQPADIAGHKDFDLSTPLIMNAGWHAIAIGTNGAGAIVRNVRTFQAGHNFMVKTGSGTSSDIRFSGAISHLFVNNAESEIENGLSEIWPINPVQDLLTVQPYGYLLFIPKWEKWT